MSCPGYSYTIGTTFSDDISGVDVDDIIQEELHSQLWSLFSNSSAWSSSTEYDWAQISDDARSENGNSEVEPDTLVPPGSYIVLFLDAIAYHDCESLGVLLKWSNLRQLKH